MSQWAETLKGGLRWQPFIENLKQVPFQNHFNWLENKILSININQIKTSDYYFMRMLIEHKTILIEYNQTKDKFSKILTDNVKQYNKSVRDKLNPLLAKLNSINQKRY